MRLKICVSIMPKTIEEAKRLEEEAERKDADLIEIRLDLLNSDTNLEDIKNHVDMIKIGTIRSSNQGGMFSGSEEARFQTLLNASRAGFDYIDIEDSVENLEIKIKSIKELGSKIIISHHNMESTPTLIELENILARNSQFKGDVYKIVTTAKSIEDSLIALNFLNTASKNFTIVCFAMGNYGRLSRVTSPFFGGFFTMASIKKGDETANGQLTIDDLKKIYQIINLD
ncbi:type I 3-dehydroquinate dehydratase [Candidatus Bathyarchaeota archaeon RBG_13_38_9]|nr:MAG: type I 3-dehydroquinate dehydratase [Candidatus Bathyarchaeota archaeon RBG_13_38_9]